MPNDFDVQDHGSIFNHDAVVRFARSGGTSALIAPLTVSRDAASSRLLGRILAAVSKLDEFPSPEQGLREISSLLDEIPGISGTVFEIDTVIDFSVDPFGDAADAIVDDRSIGGLRLIAGNSAGAMSGTPRSRSAPDGRFMDGCGCIMRPALRRAVSPLNWKRSAASWPCTWKSVKPSLCLSVRTMTWPKLT